MVHLQMVQIGTKKAFGLNTVEIVRYYVGYTVLALVVDDVEKAKDFFGMKGFETPDDEPFFNGIYAGHAYRDYYGEDSGSMTLYSVDGSKSEVIPDGYFMNYTLVEYIFMSKEKFESTFGDEPWNNTFFVRSDGMSLEEIKECVADVPGLKFCDDYKGRLARDFSTFVIFVTAISAIYILVAIIMAFLVLKNILAQFVQEKKKELIVMKLNGYEDKDAKKYILFDTILLTIIGTIPGAAIGSLVGYYAVCSFDSPTISLLKELVWISWAGGVLFTFILSLINCRSAMKQIDGFDISDINK